MRSQIVYCQKDIQKDTLIWSTLKRLEYKTEGVLRYQEDVIDYRFFDKVLVIKQGLDKQNKYFRDLNAKFSDRVTYVNVTDITDTFIFNFNDYIGKKLSTLGASWFKWNKKMPLKIGDSIAFEFENKKQTLEEIQCLLKCGDFQFGSFNVSIFDMGRSKCVFHKNLRYIENYSGKVNRCVEKENFLKISLDNPQFNAMNKKFSVSITYSGASTTEPSEVYIDLNYSPHRLSFTGIEMFGSTYFFAY